MTHGEYQQLVEYLGPQFEAIDRRFEAVGQRFEAVAQRFDAIDRRFEGLERRVEEGFREVLGHLGEIYRRLERLEQEYHAIVQGLRRIEVLLADERGRREILEQGLADLKRQVAALQARIEEIEQRPSG
jgi:predicted  nucleic acid-binding Zn-ribbon protein